jgi:hypothetical protein
MAEVVGLPEYKKSNYIFYDTQAALLPFGKSAYIA